MILRFVLFLLLNFGALAIGSIFTSKGVPSEWYAGLNKAPWTPPGWVFGAAWTTIMLCFSLFMAYAYRYLPGKTILIVLFILQWILNVTWNPVFFYYQNFLGALILISLLSLLIAFIFFRYMPVLRLTSLLLLPYLLWLLVATSLNAFIWLKN